MVSHWVERHKTLNLYLMPITGGTILEGGFDGMSFDEKKDFLRSLYPFHHKMYAIKVWRLSKTDYRWEAEGRFTDKTIEGVFQSSDGREKPFETSLQCIVNRPITDEEKKLFDKHGLTDKTLWYDSDIKKVRKLLKLCVCNDTFQTISFVV